jgi:hypothetical protein
MRKLRMFGYATGAVGIFGLGALSATLAFFPPRFSTQSERTLDLYDTGEFQGRRVMKKPRTNEFFIEVGIPRPNRNKKGEPIKRIYRDVNSYLKSKFSNPEDRAKARLEIENLDTTNYNKQTNKLTETFDDTLQVLADRVQKDFIYGPNSPFP